MGYKSTPISTERRDPSQPKVGVERAARVPLPTWKVADSSHRNAVKSEGVAFHSYSPSPLVEWDCSCYVPMAQKDCCCYLLLAHCHSHHRRRLHLYCH